MRALHRVLALFAALLMLYLGATGSMMQMLDLWTLHRHAPEADATMLSINEGRFGDPDYAVISTHDLGAASLPAAFGYDTALAAAFAADRASRPAGAAPSLAEVRMAAGAPVVQLGSLAHVRAYTPAGLPGAGGMQLLADYPPPSLRQQLKELHRFWSTHDLPGVWVELGSGVVLWVLIVSGLTMYLRLLAGRARLGRTNPFWFGGGWWQSLHRIVSAAAAVGLVAIAFSGTWLGAESVWHNLTKHGPTPDTSRVLGEAEVRHMAAVTLAAYRQAEPRLPVRVLRLRVYGGMRQGVVVTAGPPTRQLVYDADTGRSVSLTEPGYPYSGFPTGLQTHEDIKHFHSGLLFGNWARWLYLLTGLGLCYLSVSGLVMYARLWLRRRRAGRPAPIWLQPASGAARR